MEAHDGSAPWFLREQGHGLSHFLSLSFQLLLPPADSTDHFSPLFLPPSLLLSLRSVMASPRLETFCCPNRDAATDFVVSFQPVLFGALSLGSAALSLLFAVLQILPKRKGYRRLGQYPLPRPASSSRILFIISVCDILGCTGNGSKPLCRSRWALKTKRKDEVGLMSACGCAQLRTRIFLF